MALIQNWIILAAGLLVRFLEHWWSLLAAWLFGCFEDQWSELAAQMYQLHAILSARAHPSWVSAGAPVETNR